MNVSPGYIWLKEGFSYKLMLFMDRVGMKNHDEGNHLQQKLEA